MTLGEQNASLRRTLNRLLTRRLSELSERPFLQLCVLRSIRDGVVETQAQVAEFLMMDPPAVSRMVDKLEEDGLLRRCQGKDRRSLRLEVTSDAEPRIKALETCLDWLQSEVEMHLTPEECATMMRLMQKLQAGLIAAGAPAPFKK